jgi:SAM-dependent methyltransferase
MSEPLDENLYHDPNLVQFYDLANRRRVDFEYCAALAGEAISILDLGCGTGALAAAVSRDRTVIGVDPAAAMLDIARQRSGGDNVTWVQADAGSVRLGRRFDLVFLTGHAFQVFLTTAEQQAVLSTIAAHLEPAGQFVFDSRNPAHNAPKHRDRNDSVRRLDHPQLGQIEAWNESTFDESTEILTYENSYRVVDTGEVFSATSRIRYTSKEELAGMLEAAGLAVEKWLGDWQGNPFHSNAREIIPLGRLR